MSYHHGATSGDGQEIPLAPLGVTHGGLFWFFGPDNPEVHNPDNTAAVPVQDTSALGCLIV